MDSFPNLFTFSAICITVFHFLSRFCSISFSHFFRSFSLSLFSSYSCYFSLFLFFSVVNFVRLALFIFPISYFFLFLFILLHFLSFLLFRCVSLSLRFSFPDNVFYLFSFTLSRFLSLTFSVTDFIPLSCFSLSFDLCSLSGLFFSNTHAAKYLRLKKKPAHQSS